MSIVDRTEAAASHAFLTIAIPFSDDRVADVNNELEQLDNPAAKKVREALYGSGIHFLSLTVLPGDGKHRSFLLIEGSVDGSQDSAIKTLVTSFGDLLISVLKSGGINASTSALSSLLRKHAHTTRQGLFGTPGVNFSGTPEMTVKRIGQEFALARAVRTIIEQGQTKGTPLEILRGVREQIKSMEIADLEESLRKYFGSKSELDALLIPASVKLLTPQNTEKMPIVKIIANVAWKFLWPLIPFVFVTVIAATTAIALVFLYLDWVVLWVLDFSL
jgi:hypothetical protein